MSERWIVRREERGAYGHIRLRRGRDFTKRWQVVLTDAYGDQVVCRGNRNEAFSFWLGWTNCAALMS